MISDVSHYHCIRIDRKVETLCHIISNVPILVESWNKGVHIVVMKTNCPNIVITSTYGEFMEVTPGLTFTLPSFTWELVANYLMSISPHVQGVTKTHFAYLTAKEESIFPGTKEYNLFNIYIKFINNYFLFLEPSMFFK